MHIIISVTTVIILYLHGVIGLEREVFINEITSLLGATLIGVTILKANKKLDRPSILIISILIYGILSSIIGFNANTTATLYQKSRTLPILYSILCFFVGYHLIYKALRAVKSIRLDKFFSTSIFVSGIFFGGKLSPPSTLGLSLTESGSRKEFYATLITFITLMEITKSALGNADGSSTTYILLFFTIIMFFFKKTVFKAMNKGSAYPAAISIFLLFLLTLKFVSAAHAGFYIYGFSYFTGSIDTNAIWRLMFWSKTINDMSLLEWLFGIGLGTPIFDENDPSAFFIIASDPLAESRPYTLGLHNSPITFFVRFGLLGILFLFYMIINCLKSLSSHDSLKSEKLFVTLLLILIPAFFNVILESPLYSGFFWLILGVCYKNIRAIKLNEKTCTTPANKGEAS